ncbi:hypothetical protein Hanom_Chr06g00565241 [Helianthus anomalus]
MVGGLMKKFEELTYNGHIESLRVIGFPRPRPLPDLLCRQIVQKQRRIGDRALGRNWRPSFVNHIVLSHKNMLFSPYIFVGFLFVFVLFVVYKGK